MSLYDVIQRANHLVKKYEKYDTSFETKSAKTDDPFMEEYLEVEGEVEKLMEAAGDVALEHNRAIVAAKNAEIRRAKNVLITEAIAALQKKVKKGKGVNKAIIADRQEKIKEMIDRIYAIPDGMSLPGGKRPMRYGAGKGSLGSKNNPVFLNSDNMENGLSQNPLYYQHTDQTQIFEREWQQAQLEQNKILDEIGEGVNTLGVMARNMAEEVDRQNPIIDDIEHQMDKVTGQLKTNNQKLKGLVHKMRSTRNFCVDVILICILLAIAGYIYSIFAKG